MSDQEIRSMCRLCVSDMGRVRENIEPGQSVTVLPPPRRCNLAPESFLGREGGRPGVGRVTGRVQVTRVVLVGWQSSWLVQATLETREVPASPEARVELPVYIQYIYKASIGWVALMRGLTWA